MENNKQSQERTNIVFLLGEAQCGKDTIGGVFKNNYGFARVSFADKVKEDVAAMHKIDAQLLHRQGPEKEKYREAMISYAESERAKDPLVWLKKAFEPYKDQQQFKPGANLVVTDCRRDAEIDWVYDNKRHINEFDALGAKAGVAHYVRIYLFYVIRPDKPKDNDVLTHKCIGYAQGLNKGCEASGESFKLIDATINNNSSLESLQQKVATLTKTFALDEKQDSLKT